MRNAFTTATTLLMLTTFSHLTVFGQAPVGQTPGANGSPYQQRLSPYLDLLRNDNSVLHPYHSFVQPRREVQQRLRMQSSRLGQLEQNTSRMQTASRRGTSQRMQTGRGGRFQSYLHYYQFDSLPSRR